MQPPKKSLKRRLVAKAGGLAFRLAQLLLVRKDAVAAERAGQWLGRLGFRIAGKHRKRALSNLKLVFPEKTDAERHALAIRVFEHFGMLATDFLRGHIRSDEEVDASFVEVEGFEESLPAFQSGNGVLATSGHFGNWERSAQYFKMRGVPVAVVQRDANDPGMNEQMTILRRKAGVEVLSRGNAARAIIGALKQGKIVAMLADQNCSESFVPFFGLPTGTVLGPAVLHQRTKAPIIMYYSVRIGPGRYRMVLEPPLEPVPGVEDKTLALTEAMNRSLERMIRQYPEQWLWLHDRWKSARQQGLVHEP